MFTEFKKFLSKYAGELGGISTVLGSIVSALPIDLQDKARITGILSKLDDAVGSIEKALPKLKEPAKVTIKKSDIEEVVREVLPDIVRGIVVEEMAKDKPEPEAGASE